MNQLSSLLKKMVTQKQQEYLTSVSNDLSNHKLLEKINTWVLLLVFIGASYIYGLRSKKELIRILETKGLEEQFLKYESFYKRRLIWNSFSIVFSGALFVLTMKKIFFYVLIIQSVLSVAFYPRKKSNFMRT